MMPRVLIFFSLLFCFYSCKEGLFSWNLKSKPVVEEFKIVSNVLDSVHVQANLSSNGHISSTIKGFCWSDSNSEPTIYNEVIIIDNSDEGIYNASFSWDTSSTVKYVRAFAQNELGITYSQTITMFWPVGSGNIPEVNTISVEDIGFYSAKVSGELISNGGIPWTTKGILFSENNNPSMSNSIIIMDDTEGNSYSITYDNLLENKTYYTRAFAQNDGGVDYGQVISFTTKNFYEIGEQGPGGGIIFYNKLDSSGGWNFLELSSSDLPTEVIWGNSLTLLNTSNDIGTGKENTDIIVSEEGTSGVYAAGNCSSYINMGFDDWFLPSRAELMLVYDNLYMTGAGNLDGVYWTSSQDQTYSQNAWTIKMTQGDNIITSRLKTLSYKFRPVRRF